MMYDHLVHQLRIDNIFWKYGWNPELPAFTALKFKDWEPVDDPPAVFIVAADFNEFTRTLRALGVHISKQDREALLEASKPIQED